MRRVDDSAFQNVSQQQTQRLLDVITSSGGLSAASKLEKVEVAEKTFQATHESGSAIANAASGIAAAMLAKVPEAPKQKAKEAVKVVRATVRAVEPYLLDARDALPPAWISASFFIVFFSYILYHKYIVPLLSQ